MSLASYGFLLAFLPLALALCYGAARRGPRAAAAALCAASFLFCAWGSPSAAVLLALSSLVSFPLSRALARAELAPRRAQALLALGITAHLALLGYFKYAGFLLENWNALFGSALQLAPGALPLGISFFTFQQIAYLVEARRGETRGHGWLDYALFVSFFPKLVAGPLADPRALVPQFSRPEFGRYRAEHLGVGLTLLTAGLVKKVLIANRLGGGADAVFAGAANGLPLSSAQAWLGVLGYGLQLYFDFSGYSDMAIGAARCFGVRLPLNFDSPYRSTSIVEFWQRWHITLGRFLTRYIYTPIATPIARFALERELGPLSLFATSVALPTVLTFAIVGLWHGAGWNYVAFGALHGVYLSVNQGWRQLRRWAFGRAVPSRVRSGASWALTFSAVLVSYVLFRSTDLRQAWAMFAALSGAHGWGGLTLVAHDPLLEQRDLVRLAVGAALALLAPNSAQLLADFAPALDKPRGAAVPLRWRWAPQPLLAVLCALLLLASLAALGSSSEFIYYRF